MLRRFIAGALLVLLLGGCDFFGDGSDPLPPRGRLTSPTTGDERVIALVGTLSGPDAWRGDDAYEGAEVAVRWLNRNLADDERPFALGTVDDEGDPQKALQRVRE